MIMICGHTHLSLASLSCVRDDSEIPVLHEIQGYSSVLAPGREGEREGGREGGNAKVKAVLIMNSPETCYIFSKLLPRERLGQ